MSVQHIVREFPFMRLYPSDAPHIESWPGATTDMRVSRLSLDALFLPMGNIEDGEVTRMNRYLDVKDELGRDVFPSSTVSSSSRGENDTIGDALLRVFTREEKERTTEVCYIVYQAQHEAGKVRRDSSTGRASRKWRREHTEVVLFKMPKTRTLWEILQRYRKARAKVRSNY